MINGMLLHSLFQQYFSPLPVSPPTLCVCVRTSIPLAKSPEDQQHAKSMPLRGPYAVIRYSCSPKNVSLSTIFPCDGLPVSSGFRREPVLDEVEIVASPGNTIVGQKFEVCDINK